MTPEELERWLHKMAHWRLLRQRYMVRDGEGEWLYKLTILGEIVLLSLEILGKMRLIPRETTE